MAFSDLARLDGYDPNAVFPDSAPEDEARWAREAAAARLGNTRRQQGSGAERGERIMGGLADLTMAIGQPITDITNASRERFGEGPMTEEQAFRINQGGPAAAQLGALALGRNPLGAVTQAELRGGQLTSGAKRMAPVVPARTLFDYSRVHDVPGVQQFDLTRYNPKHGVSERVDALVKDKNVERQMLEKIEKGKGINAETFYYNEPLREAFVAELGKTQGPKDFARYMDYVAATSPRSDVETNARNASYYYMLEKQGRPVPQKGGVNEQPYGHMAQNLHRQNAANIRSGDYFNTIKNPKPLSFSQNLQGNFAPVTVDAHAFKLPAMLARDPEFLAGSLKLEKGAPTINPTKMYKAGDLTMDEAFKRPVFWDSVPNRNEYGAMEQYYKRLAAESGMTPAQTQAAAWAGGGDTTGLASVAGDPFMRSVENRANITAAKRGITPAEALSRMMRGKEPLLAVPPAAVMGGLAAQDEYRP